MHASETLESATARRLVIASPLPRRRGSSDGSACFRARARPSSGPPEQHDRAEDQRRGHRRTDTDGESRHVVRHDADVSSRTAGSAVLPTEVRLGRRTACPHTAIDRAPFRRTGDETPTWESRLRVRVTASNADGSDIGRVQRDGDRPGICPSRRTSSPPSISGSPVVGADADGRPRSVVRHAADLVHGYQWRSCNPQRWAAAQNDHGSTARPTCPAGRRRYDPALTRDAT